MEYCCKKRPFPIHPYVSACLNISLKCNQTKDKLIIIMYYLGWSRSSKNSQQMGVSNPRKYHSRGNVILTGHTVIYDIQQAYQRLVGSESENTALPDFKEVLDDTAEIMLHSGERFCTDLIPLEKEFINKIWKLCYQSIPIFKFPTNREIYHCKMYIYIYIYIWLFQSRFINSQSCVYIYIYI